MRDVLDALLGSHKYSAAVPFLRRERTFGTAIALRRATTLALERRNYIFGAK
jgi:hypothetical protein